MPRIGWRATLARVGLSLLVACAGGCAFRKLGRDLERREALTILRGAVSSTHQGTIVVVLYDGDAGAERIVDDFVLAGPGPYYFVVTPGAYRLAAFADHDGGLSYEADDEPAVLYRGGEAVHAGAGQTIDGLDMDLGAAARERIDFAVALAPGSTHGLAEIPDIHVGDVVPLDDSRFSDAHAELGLWEPVHFLFDVGAGVYFLEPYADDRIPVLFVHGALGHPGIWRPMIAGLDRSRFQPWLVYYPTAVGLEGVAAGLDRWMQSLWVMYRFPRVVVVGHSMGGLVARAFINRSVARATESGRVALFVSMATPWQGQAAAALGVAQAPVVAPSWYDMSPGSRFLQSLLAAPLPPEIPYHLLFTYGGGSGLIRGANDGAVTLASQLADPAQRQAVQVYGFDVGHGAILRDPAAIAEVARIVGKVE